MSGLMKVLITGSRNWSDRKAIETAMTKFKPEIIIEGGANGADRMAKEYANNNNKKVIEAKANWEKYGKQAGPIRNAEMISMKPDLVIAFSKDLNEDRGTRDTINKAIAKGIKVWLVKNKDEFEEIEPKSI